MTTKTMRWPRRRKTTSRLLPAFLPAAALFLLPLGVPSLLLAQTAPAVGKNHVPIQRICEGKVVGKGGQAVGGAIVYLKDPKSLAIRSYLSDDQGRFHFAQIQPDTDYELWAESNGAQTKTKRIGMFDNHTTFNFTLKMENKKSK